MINFTDNTNSISFSVSPKPFMDIAAAERPAALATKPTIVEVMLTPRMPPDMSLGKKNASFQMNLALMCILLSVIITASQNARIHSGMVEAKKKRNVFCNAL